MTDSLIFSQIATQMDRSEEMFEVHARGKQKTFMCSFPDCGKVFRYKSEIVRHIATHSEYRPFNCEHPGCNKSFKRRDALENHVRTHTKEKPFTCPHDGCEQSFPTKASLRYHLLKHEGQRLYKCNFPGCDKTFITLSQLKQHENSNSVHKHIKPMYQTEAYESIFYADEPALEKKLPQTYQEDFLEWVEPIKAENMNDKKETENDLNKALKENELLKKKLEESQKLISILQQRAQMDPFTYMDHFSGNDLFGESNVQLLNTDLFLSMDE
jgi:uncharacterized C2H2 Zn-finger protein